MGSNTGSRRRLRPGDLFRATVVVDGDVLHRSKVFKLGKKCSKTVCCVIDPRSPTGEKLRGKMPGQEFSWKELHNGVQKTVVVTIHEVMDPSADTSTVTPEPVVV